MSLVYNPSRLFLKSDFFHDGRVWRGNEPQRCVLKNTPKINLKIKTYRHTQTRKVIRRRGNGIYWDIDCTGVYPPPSTGALDE